MKKRSCDQSVIHKDGLNKPGKEESEFVHLVCIHS